MALHQQHVVFQKDGFWFNFICVTIERVKAICNCSLSKITDF